MFNILLLVTGLIVVFNTFIFLIIYVSSSNNLTQTTTTPPPSTTTPPPSTTTPAPTGDVYPMISNYCDSGCNTPATPNPSPQFYMCPHLMLGSEDLKKAAEQDGNDWAYYGVASHFNDKGGCGRCYQISYLPYCGKYWADDADGELCCMSGDDCNYSTPYDCFQSQLSHCCLNGTCDDCTEWSGPNSTTLSDENPDKDSCESKGGTFCKGWCEVCKGPGGDCSECEFYPQKPLIVQSFNTGIDCTPPADDSAGQFDIYMGAGGLGANVGCAEPSSDGIYGGGFYGGALDDWPDYKEGHRNGGVSRFDMCDEIKNIQGFRKNDSDWNGQKNWGMEMIDSCKLAMGSNAATPVNPYHGNWAVRYKEVECPVGLTNVTGLRLKYPSKGVTGNSLSKPSKDYVKGSGREGSNDDGFPGFTSSMMDCCKPSCSVNDIVESIKETGNDIDANYTSIFMCNKDGEKIKLDKSGIEQAYIVQPDGKKVPCYDSEDLPECQEKMKDYEPNCKSDEDCCSEICSTGKYNSMCCPFFGEPDGDGGCK